MKHTWVTTSIAALVIMSTQTAFASRFHVIHHMRNGMHHMRVKMHHGHQHMHNMLYHGHM